MTSRPGSRSQWCDTCCSGFFLVAALMVLSMIHPDRTAGYAGTPPFSFSAEVLDEALIDEVVMPPVDVERYLREDEEREDEPGPLRFAAPIPVELDPLDSGTWEELPGGGRLWRLRVRSPGALTLNFGFTSYRLPPGATLHLIAANRSVYEGPYNAGDNHPTNELWTAVIPGDAVTIELFVPTAPEFEPELVLGQVNHDYRGFLTCPEQDWCNIDVICPEGNPWRDEIRAVARYTLSGIEQCSGTLLNSWDDLRPPYFLTANHCGVTTGNDHTVVVYWNYESPTCGRLGGGSTSQNQSGTTWRAARSESDFTLLQLNNNPNPSFNVYYSGWDATGSTADESIGIHHPRTCEKALAINDDPLTVTSYYGTSVPGDGTHWRVDAWDAQVSNPGTTERGSSGSGLWSEDHRLVGQLHGGDAGCSTPNGSDWYGRFSVSWDAGSSSSTRLQDWLDPGNRGYQIADGSDQGCTYATLVSGTSATASGSPRLYRFDQPRIYWSAVGVRSSGTDDWDLYLYDTNINAPTCVTNLHANSLRVSGVDFVIGDYNHSPLGIEYAEAYRYSGSGNGVVEWDDDANLLSVDGSSVSRTTGPSDVLEVWDVNLSAGIEYTFEFEPEGSADLKLLLFRNPASSSYWAGRNFAVFEVTNSTMYTAPANDWYGVVVVNDNGASGSYSLRVTTCPLPVALASGVSVPTGAPDGHYAFTQWAAYWTAIGVRSTSDWDIGIYADGSGGAPPVCFNNLLGSSTQLPPVVDLVVGDMNHGALTTYYARPYRYSGTADARTEWDDGNDQLMVNGPIVARETDANDILECWDVYLVAGTEYTLEFSPNGSADLKLLLYRNPASAVYWTGRGARVYEATGTGNYTAPADDWYGLVVVNDNGASGSYRFRVMSCPEPLPLSSGVSVGTEAPGGHYSFNQQSGYWAAVGVRGQGDDDWDIGIYENGSGSPPPICFGGLLSTSTQLPPVADFVIADFNHTALRTYYAHTYRYSGAGDARTEWDDGADVLTVDGTPVSRTTGATDVLEVWDVRLTGGTEYNFIFQRGGSADTKLLVFRSLGGTYWTPRSSRVLETTVSTSYTAPATDSYGVVVVNDNGASGDYQLQVLGPSQSVTAPGRVPAVSMLRQVLPNPAFGHVDIGFDLAEPGTVAFRILDVTGRLVASLPERQWEAGSWSERWNGRTKHGGAAPSGVYWVKMSVSSREIGRTRFLILR